MKLIGPPVTPLPKWMVDLVDAEMSRITEAQEALLVEAVMLQDYDRLDDLTVVDQQGHHPAVASLLR